jgi:hypothetical protein
VFDAIVTLVACLALLGSLALITVIPWMIGLGWMAHHWFGV